MGSHIIIMGFFYVCVSVYSDKKKISFLQPPTDLPLAPFSLLRKKKNQLRFVVIFQN